MHTVNKAYAVLRQEGLLRLDRRTGAVIAVNIDKLKAMDEMQKQLRLVIARGLCKGISRGEVHQLVDEIFPSMSSVLFWRNSTWNCVRLQDRPDR